TVHNMFFFFSSRRRHTRSKRDWSSDVCSSDLVLVGEQGGTPIGGFQLVQAMLADQYAGVAAGRALVRETAAAYDSGEDRRIAPSAAKLYCTEMAGDVADLAVQIHGGSGYLRGVAVERIYRDSRLVRRYEGTSEIQRLIVGGGLSRRANAVSGQAGAGRGPHSRGKDAHHGGA